MIQMSKIISVFFSIYLFIPCQAMEPIFIEIDDEETFVPSAIRNSTHLAPVNPAFDRIVKEYEARVPNIKLLLTEFNNCIENGNAEVALLALCELRDASGYEIVRKVPQEIWYLIFTFNAPFFENSINDISELSEFLSWRRVSKLWNEVILNAKKISIPECLNHDRCLQIFKNVNELVISQNVNIDLSCYLTNLTNLSFFQGSVAKK